uniref:Cation:H+ antiporter n=1 Tax=Candidatus Kentrum sp. FW TaxID=2126338 RepID=A0A450S8D6_9GAMM|nr:MAG: cation:H+ antiporter [Candidatus Kentron sp. FW]VFJ53587.1 MAG: cation:H+ antiporter [Candidatus Kentron sp. FW]
MLYDLIAIVLGIGLLVWGSDRLVFGASAVAGNLGVSPLIIGLTIVGIGTSAPEIMVAAMAAWQGNPDVAIGNAIGSNIANIGLVIGLTALTIPLMVNSMTLRTEFPLMFVVLFLAGFLLWDEELSRADGMILMGGFGLLLARMVHMGLAARHTDPMRDEFSSAVPVNVKTVFALFQLLVGLGVLLLGSRIVIWGAVNVAETLGVSDLVIGLTIIAVGTSLPELGACMMSAYKKEPDIAIGNVIGSNMFNLLPVLGLPGIIAPGPVSGDVLDRDLPILLVLSVILMALAYGFRKPARINRWEGAVLLMIFCGYQFLLYLSAS